MGQKLRIIMVEDIEDHALLTLRELKKGGLDIECVLTDSEETLREALEEGGWDLVITDYSMPVMNGIDCVRIVRQSSAMPVIIISGMMGEETAIEAMKAGADDYVLKSNISRLVPAIKRALRDAEDRKARQKAEQEARLLTRLLNTVLDINQMIARVADSRQLLDETCSILVKHGGFSLAWVGMADFSSGRVLPVAHSGAMEGYLERVSVRCDDTPEGNGPIGKAIRSGTPAVCLDIGSDKAFTPWLKAELAFGFTSCAAFPVSLHGRVVGAINVYSESSSILEQKMVMLLEELANDVGHALGSIEETERKRAAEKSLRQSEEKLSTIFESSKDGMFVMDPGGRFLDVNMAGSSIFGYSKEEILANDMRLLFFNNSIGKEALEELFRQGGFLHRLRLRGKDGAEVITEMTAAPFRVGEKDMVLGVLRDITERVRVEGALKENEERFRQVFLQSEDAKLIFRAGSSAILDANPSAVALYGYSKKELTSSGPSLFISPPELARFEAAISGLMGLKGKKGFGIERLETARNDGAKLIVSVRAQVIRLKQNAVVYCTVRDITEMIRMEEESRYIQAKLIHANKMTSIGTLASGVAHEINNPNNFILFNSTLLSEAWRDTIGILNEYEEANGDFSLGGLPYSEMRTVIPELLSGITDGARRIKGIVDNLKDFSRTDKSGMDGEFDVNRVVVASVSILSNQINKYTDNFHVFCGKGLPAVRGSAQKIEQVVINLIMNALHALADRKRSVWVSTDCDRGADQISITVRDEGIGMTQEVLDRITEPFFTTKTDSGGTGLGLSISYTIIKEHGGSLEFASGPDKGTTVTVRLPVTIAESERRRF